MKRLFIILSLISVSLMGWADINWSGIDWVNENGNTTYKQQFKVAKADGQTVVNIQQPGWASELGIYTADFGGAISTCSLGDKCAIDGGGMVMYLSAFTQKETEVTVTAAEGTKTFTVCNAAYDTSNPSISEVTVNYVSESSAVISVTASDDIGIKEFVVKNNGSDIGTYTNSTFSITGLSSSSTYNQLTVTAVDAKSNNSDASSIEAFTTAAAPTTVPATDESREECQVLGVFGTSRYSCSSTFSRHEDSWGNTTHEQITIDGKNVEHITSGTSAAIGIGDTDTRSYSRVSFDIWCSSEQAFGLKLLCWNGSWQNGTTVNFTTANAGWKTIDIALSDFEQSSANLKKTVIFQFLNLNNIPIYITNVFYYTDDEICMSEPEEAPSATLQTDCQVFSLFSDYNYTGQTVKMNHSTWCGGTMQDVVVDGKRIKKLSGSSGCYGLEKDGWNTTGKMDVSGYDYLHVDVWVPQITTLRLFPINRNTADNGNDAEKYVEREITTLASWVSLDIPLSEFTSQGLDLSRQYQFKFDGLSGKKMWFTNLYFYKTAECSPTWETWNLALNKPSNAGYEWENADEKKEKANDGNENTGWVTYNVSSSDNEWWYVDLQKNYNINKIEVVWYDTYYSTSYKLQTRVETPSALDEGDNSKWVDVTVDPIANASGGTVTTNCTATGRYVRVHSLTKAAGWIKMGELRVFATGLAVTDINDPEITTAEVADDSENINSVKLHLVATDVEDGAVTTFLLNKGDDNWIPIVTNAYDFYTVSDLERGHYSYQVKARDHAGNVSVISTINFDIFDPDENLALYQDVEAGYTNPDNVGEAPAMANDGNYGSPWTTFNNRPMDEQWWSVDLGDVYQLSNIDLFWGVKSDHYLLQVAHAEPADRSDDTQWYTIHEVNETQTTGGAEDDKNRYAVDASARYIRFKAVEKADSYLKLWELRVYGSAFATADVNAPEITAASVSYNLGKVYLTLEASDTEDGTIKTFRVVNTTTGDKQLLTTNGDNQIIIEGLEINTLYEYEIQAMDKAANLSAVQQLNVNVPMSSGTNLAKNKSIVVGYETGGAGESKEKANDGDPSTFWATWGWQDAAIEWMYVDLGALYDLKQIVVKWDASWSTDYILQGRRTAPAEEDEVNDDAWDDLAEETSASSTNKIVSTDVSGVARYVRFRSKTRSDQGFRMSEFEVYANAAVLPFVDDGNNSTSIAANDQAVVNVEFPREILADNTWYTICLPFDLDAAKVNAVFGACTIAQLVDTEDRGSLLHLNFNYVNAIQAGKPYMIKVGNAFTAGSTIENVTIQNIAPVETGDAGMKFIGTFDQKELNQSNQRFVGPDDYLYSPAEGGTTMGAFRCYFTIPDGSPASAPGKRAKIVFAPQQTTDIDQTAEQATPSKFILNGVLYILRDGKTYNAQGLLIQ